MVRQAALPTRPVRLRDETDKHYLRPWALSLPSCTLPYFSMAKSSEEGVARAQASESWLPLSHLRNDVLQGKGLDSLGCASPDGEGPRASLLRAPTPCPPWVLGQRETTATWPLPLS